MARLWIRRERFAILEGEKIKFWDLHSVSVQPHRPEIISSGGDARLILINLPAGEVLQDHQVHERAWVTIIDGQVTVQTGQDEPVTATPGFIFEFEPRERHGVVAITDARLFLLLTPWPGKGHPGTMTLEDKSTVRERR